MIIQFYSFLYLASNGNQITTMGDTFESPSKKQKI